MITRHIPGLARHTAPIGLGCMGMSWAYNTPGTSDDAGHIAVINAALDAGISLLDTSDAYADGANEELVGRAVARRRDDAIIASKGGLISSYVNGQPHLERDGRPVHLRKAIDASLQRLDVDVIDLYYLHRIDPKVPLEDSWGALAEAVTAGKIHALGLSEVSEKQAARAHVIHPVSAVQSEMSLWTRDALGDGLTSDGDPAGNLVGWCREADAIFVPFAPLGRGFLTGVLDPSRLVAGDLRANLPRFQGTALSSNQSIVDAVLIIAARHATTAAAVALAWVLAQGEHIIPIPGTTKIERLSENLSAAGLQLTQDDLATLDALPAPVGARY